MWAPSAGAGRRDLLLILFLAAAPLLAYAPAWLEGRLLAPGDGAALHLPLRAEVWRAWGRGEVPSWNGSIFSGTPLLASYRPGAFHPLVVALTPLAPFGAFQLLVLASLALVGPLTFLYARRLGADRVGALVAGIGFALGPCLVARLGDTALVTAAPALPLLLLAAEAHLTRARASTSAALAVAVTLLLLAGSKEAVGAGALLLGARLLLAPAGEGRGMARGLRSTAAAVLAGVLLAAPQLVPTLIALREAGPGGTGVGGDEAAALAGLAGLVLRYVSHTPAAVFALAAVPLLASLPALRPVAAVAGLGLLLFAGQGATEGVGALPLAFDFALALLGGLSLSAQWRARHEPRGRRLRQLALLASLSAAASLSVATTVTGPLAPQLAAPVGLLALGLILYFALAERRDAAVAHVFLLPVLASFLLQPSGRDAWAGAPTVAELEQATPTREALDHAMGERRAERTLTLATSWPRARERDLAWANRASLTAHRSVNGYDPMVPASRLAVLDGMGSDGTVSRRLLETDPGRLELLGVRWVQVPTEALVVPADGDGLGEALDVVLQPPRPHLFPLPITRATEVRVVSFLSGAVEVEQGRVVAECVARLASGREIWLPIRAGIETAEWAWERPDVRRAVRHEMASVHASFPAREGFTGHEYLGVLRLQGRFAVSSLRLRAWPGAPPIWLLRAGLRDAEAGRGVGLSAASAYVSDEVRLAEAAGTPLVSLFEVRRGIGPAWVVDSLRRLPDEARVLDVLRSPTRLGVDARREALATEKDARGVVLPPGSRSSPADLARAAGGRIVVRAAGPGLLVTSEGYDPGFRARVDGRAAPILRVNADRMGVVLGEGTHRVVFTHRARGLFAGLVLAALGAAGLAGAFLAERRRAV
ncbi:MAG TPA: hypothetical protein VE359_19505 [Vicinamibacteria bacterium]|nr:hypothetical protein [Vicinamibacteria bacterium]